MVGCLILGVDSNSQKLVNRLLFLAFELVASPPSRCPHL